MERMQNDVFSSVDCSWLWKVCWLWKVPVSVSQTFKVMSFCLHTCTRAHTQLLFPLTNSFDVLWYTCTCVIDVLHQVAGVLVQCTHIPASVAKCCSRLGFQVNRTVRQTHICRGKILCFLLKELDSFRNTDLCQNASFPPQLFKSK